MKKIRFVILVILGCVMMSSCGAKVNTKDLPTRPTGTPSVTFAPAPTQAPRLDSTDTPTVEVKATEDSTNTPPPSSTPTELSEKKYVRVKEDGINFRKEASRESESLGIINTSEKLLFLGEEGDWIFVERDSTKGYVRNDYIVGIDLTDNSTGKITTPSSGNDVKAGTLIVAIDAGHQAKGNNEQEPIGPGANSKKPKVSSGTAGTTTKVPEYKLTLAVSLKLRDELVARGYKVVMIRETNDVDISNKERAEIATNANADILVRIHADGSENSGVNGILTLCPTESNPFVSHLYAKSRRLSSCILSEMVDATGAKNRGISEVRFRISESEKML